MANFQIAHELVTLQYEGFYDNDPPDPETCWGLTRRDEPDWEGWVLIDKYKKEAGNPTEAAKVRLILAPIKNQLRDMTAPTYRRKYWNPLRGDEIIDQTMANKFFDTAVLNNPDTAIGMMQEEVGIKKDGKMSDELLSKLNATI